MRRRTFDPVKLVRPLVQSLKPYGSARSTFEATGKGYIFLDANESPFENGANRYPDPFQKKLKNSIGKLKNVEPSQIFIGNGSDEILELLFKVFCEPGKDNSIHLPPTFGMYRVLAELHGIEILSAPLNADFDIDVLAVLKTFTKHSKLLFLCSPNNPTGNNLSFERIQELAEKFHGIVVLDEAYIDFSDQKSGINLLEKYPNLIVLQTLSKAYGLAGIRLGMGFASREIIALLNKVKPPYNVNVLSQQRALKALEKPSETKSQIQLLKSERERLKEEFLKLSFVEKVHPSAANFLLAEVDNSKKRYEQLVENIIVVRNLSDKYNCKNTLRITVGTSKENDTLIAVCRKLNKI